MNLLLDTHAFLWFAAGDERLGARARRQMEAEDAQLHLSAAAVWEIAIKASLGRLSLPSSVADYVAEKVRDGVRILPVEWQHAAAVAEMPFHHRDPFDRLMIAQSKLEDMPIVTSDRLFSKYGVSVIW